MLKKLLGSRAFTPFRRAAGELLQRTQWRAWARLHTGQRLQVDLSSTIGRSILLRGRYEPLVEAVLRSVLEPGDAFVDVGANVGYFAVIASPLVGAAGSVHCFEPNSAVAALLLESVERNGLANVLVEQRALWSRTARQRLHVERNSAISFLEPGEAPIAGSEVAAVRLDDYLVQHARMRVSLIKLDIEGAELHALRGAEALLARQKPVLIVEAQDWCLRRYGQDLPDLFGYLEAQGYSAYDLHGAAVPQAEEARRRLAGEWVKNLVFRPV